jgi:hypothetical protein
MGPPMGIEAWMTFLLCRWATHHCPGGRTCSRPVCRSEFSSGHWPASGVSWHVYECPVGGPLNVLRDRLWVVPCRGGGCRKQQVARRLEYSTFAGSHSVYCWHPSDLLTVHHVVWLTSSFTLLRGRITWAIFDSPLAYSQWRCSMPFLTAWDFHWAQ